MRPARIALAAAAVLALAPLPLAAAATAPARTISVSGTATLQVAPDRAALSLGVSRNAETAAGALSSANAAMQKVIDAVKAAGVAAKDIQTSQVSLGQRTDQNGKPIGFSAVDSASVTVRDLGRTGPVIDAAVAAGANQISGPTFTRADTDSLYRRALAAAFAQAKAKATTLAASAGLRLGKATQIQESSSQVPIAFQGAAASDKAAAPTPVEPGQVGVTAGVTVTFAAS